MGVVGRWLSAETKQKISQNRKSKAQGEDNASAILTTPQVLTVVSLYNSGFGSHAKIASLYGVSPSTVRHILSGLIWGHATGIVGHRKRRKAN